MYLLPLEHIIYFYTRVNPKKYIKGRSSLNNLFSSQRLHQIKKRVNLMFHNNSEFSVTTYLCDSAATYLCQFSVLKEKLLSRKVSEKIYLLNSLGEIMELPRVIGKTYYVL